MAIMYIQIYLIKLFNVAQSPPAFIEVIWGWGVEGFLKHGLSMHPNTVGEHKMYEKKNGGLRKSML